MDGGQNVGQCVKWLSVLSRKKELEANKEEETKLARVLGLWDLTGLGIGATLGLGVYVLAGAVAKTDAGPAVTLSFLIAAVASAFAALCYAEFAARVPKAGSAYVYSYVTVGEFAAFVIGWNLILEYAIGTASTAKGLSNYLDVLLGNVMKKTMRSLLPMDISFLAPYPDFFACSVVLLLSGLLSWGVKESTTINSLFTVINLITVSTVIFTGFFKIQPGYWNISKEEIPKGVRGGEGGFLPFGWAGVMAGSAKCFYGFVGFDSVATTGEEAKNPKKHIPLSIVLSLIVIFVAYFGVATVLTMMVPYYEQDSDAPLPHVYEKVGWPLVKLLVSGGAVCALCTSMLGAVFPLPRILYSMANDGLLFNVFSYVNVKTKTPVCATLISGVLSGIMAALFDLDQLIDMMSIGTLLAYSIVAICILLLRYREEHPAPISLQNNIGKQNRSTGSCTIYVLKQAFNLNGLKYPTSETESISEKTILVFCVTSALLCFTTIHMQNIVVVESIYIAMNVVFLIVCGIALIVLSRQPQANASLFFKVPLVPLVPCLSVIINFFLMLKLDINTWIRFILWLFIGLLIYVYYSVDHSVQGSKNSQNNIQDEKRTCNKFSSTTVDKSLFPQLTSSVSLKSDVMGTSYSKSVKK